MNLYDIRLIFNNYGATVFLMQQQYTRITLVTRHSKFDTALNGSETRLTNISSGTT